LHRYRQTAELKMQPLAACRSTSSSTAISKPPAKEQMLTAGAPSGSGAYVAIERVTGSLHGRNGSSLLQHSGTMTRGQPQMTIAVVPDSGADELAGISGNLAIQIVDGKHFYNFDYTLSETS